VSEDVVVALGMCGAMDCFVFCLADSHTWTLLMMSGECVNMDSSIWGLFYPKFTNAVALEYHPVVPLHAFWSPFVLQMVEMGWIAQLKNRVVLE
jgi:hypothetical protein